MEELDAALAALHHQRNPEVYYSQFLLYLYLGSLIYLSTIWMFKEKISSHIHRSFINYHIWSLPLLAICVLFIRVYSSFFSDPNPPPQLQGIIAHMIACFCIWLSCLIYWRREMARVRE
ncbi:MAG: hypothetical protein HQL32_03430 [Planctomycetes bacterium]|nr:hypothetical protein [Planctomycetota bacterium]